jgi:hypothetical protein
VQTRAENEEVEETVGRVGDYDCGCVVRHNAPRAEVPECVRSCLREEELCEVLHVDDLLWKIGRDACTLRAELPGATNMAVLIKNPSVEVCALPFPLKGHIGVALEVEC